MSPYAVRFFIRLSPLKGRFEPPLRVLTFVRWKEIVLSDRNDGKKILSDKGRSKSSEWDLTIWLGIDPFVRFGHASEERENKSWRGGGINTCVFPLFSFPLSDPPNVVSLDRLKNLKIQFV